MDTDKTVSNYYLDPMTQLKPLTFTTQSIPLKWRIACACEIFRCHAISNTGCVDVTWTRRAWIQDCVREIKIMISFITQPFKPLTFTTRSIPLKWRIACACEIFRHHTLSNTGCVDVTWTRRAWIRDCGVRERND